jgi:hypothetical protein
MTHRKQLLATNRILSRLRTVEVFTLCYTTRGPAHHYQSAKSYHLKFLRVPGSNV